MWKLRGIKNWATQTEKAETWLFDGMIIVAVFLRKKNMLHVFVCAIITIFHIKIS